MGQFSKYLIETETNLEDFEKHVSEKSMEFAAIRDSLNLEGIPEFRVEARMSRLDAGKLTIKFIAKNYVSMRIVNNIRGH